MHLESCSYLETRVLAGPRFARSNEAPIKKHKHLVG
jgi:hypothetical protein